MANVGKPVNTLVIDTGAIIKNDPAITTLLSTSESLVTVPAIISEMQDATTRSRVETTLLPFLKLRSPSPTSIKFVTDFARKTGDLAVLSKPDIQIIALTYELECERNGGDWRLRSVPGQKRLNGAPPARTDNQSAAEEVHSASIDLDSGSATTPAHDAVHPTTAVELNNELLGAAVIANGLQSADQVAPTAPEDQSEQTLADGVDRLNVEDGEDEQINGDTPRIDSAQTSGVSQEDSDLEGWITPSNLKKRQAHDAGASASETVEPKTMQVGVLTTDFAMQNVILQMNLNLLSRSITRVKHVKTYVLRCHACFQVVKDMSKQFCPRCGKPTLTRVSCSTNANGEFKLHLKKNMQWNIRGDRYSIPRPVHGAANGKVKGGGKGHWGNELMLAEDQKEYERAMKTEKKRKERSLMDEDYLPSILTGDRGRIGGRTKVGAGRNVNAKKR